MNRAQANLILNKAKEGQNIDRESITAALVATGDLDGLLAQRNGSEALDAAVRRDEESLRPEASGSLVAADHSDDPENPRRWCSAYIAGRYEQAGK